MRILSKPSDGQQRGNEVEIANCMINSETMSAKTTKIENKYLRS